MTAAVEVELEPGRVYRTADLAKWSANPSRLVKRLVGKGDLRPLRRRGLFACPQKSRFGNVPPRDETTLTAFLKNTPFVFTGSEQWNALGLGSTSVFAMPLIYNRKRSGTFVFNDRKFRLRRVAFPENPPPEWYIVDLLENADQAGADLDELERTLGQALQNSRFSSSVLVKMAAKYGIKATQERVKRAVNR